MTIATLTPVASFRQSAIVDGFKYECSCGELYSSIDAAYSCRKCRTYCVFGYCTHVVEISTGDVVAGEVPDVEDYERAEKAAEARWAEEKAALDLYAQMLAKEGDLYNAEIARQKTEAADRREEDLWALQDRMMGIH